MKDVKITDISDRVIAEKLCGFISTSIINKYAPYLFWYYDNLKRPCMGTTVFMFKNTDDFLDVFKEQYKDCQLITYERLTNYEIEIVNERN